jgi:hypothetical protein
MFLIFIGQDENLCRWNEILDAPQCGFEQRFLAEKREQLFGPRFSTQRPEAFTASTRENQNVKRAGHAREATLKQRARRWEESPA